MLSRELTIECFKDFPKFLSFGSRGLNVVGALSQFLGPLCKLLLALGKLALQCVVLLLQVGNLLPHISSLTLEQVALRRWLTKICCCRRPLRIARRLLRMFTD